MKMQRSYYRLMTAFVAMTVVALCTGCKPAEKSAGAANADSAAASSASAPNK